MTCDGKLGGEGAPPEKDVQRGGDGKCLGLRWEPAWCSRGRGRLVGGEGAQAGLAPCGPLLGLDFLLQ